MNHFFKTLCLAGSVSFLATAVEAQQGATSETKAEKEIIIRKKTDVDTKLTIEINGDQVKVNGKPLAEFDDKNIDIDLENIRPRVLNRLSTARSPFRGGSTWNTDAEPLVVTGYGINSNKALLGVSTEKTDEGAKVRAVTKSSAAEKAGIKVGDVILKINDTKVESPEDLAKTVGKFKPEEKVDVRLKRDQKEQTVSATLAKPSATTVYSQNFDFNYNNSALKRYNDNRDNMNDRVVIGYPTPRLGIKAQDTEDGKGVKVLGVDEGSAAQKSGIKEGDLITEFEGKAVNDATELMQAARTAKDKNNMKVKLTRDGKSQDLEIKIPKKLKTQNL